MTTLVTYYTEPTNLDHLMINLRIRYGDLTGSTYSDATLRTALVNAVAFLQNRWSSKYQTYRSDLLVDPQPSTVPAGFVLANTAHGTGYIPDALENGSAFRNPFITFNQPSPPIIETIDEEAIVLAATYLLRRVQVSSSLTGFVSWSTEDIRYSNLGSERGLSGLVNDDLKALNDYFRANIAKPRVLAFAPVPTPINI